MFKHHRYPKAIILHAVYFKLRFTLSYKDVEGLLKHKYEYEGVEYITFEVAQMQKPDDFNRTHTAYVTTREEVPEKETAEA